MMRFTAAVLLIGTALSAQAGELTVTIPLDPCDINIYESDVYTIVTGTGMGLTGVTGEPSLPAFTERIALPAGCAATSVETVNAEYSQAEGFSMVMPYQTPVPLSLMEGHTEFIEPDPEIYGASAFYPEHPFEFRGSSVILGIPVAFISVFPARWNPSSGTLELLTNLTVRVEYESSPEALTVSRRSAQSENRSRETVMNTVANPQGVEGSGAVIVDSRDLAYGEYVIITTDEYQGTAQELADWKTLKGVPASVYTTGWIVSSYSFYDLQQEIRAFLTDCRDEGVEFVLIYGDDDVVEGRDARISAGSTVEFPPVDLYWSDINDMVPGADLWDSNSNHIWGQFGIDQVDYHPDLWVGRASVNTLEEAEIFNQKVFIYEGVASSDYFESSCIEERIGYTTELLWPGCYGSAGAELISEMVPVGWEEEKCYDSEGNNSVVITNGMLNAGPHHVYHASHGAQTLFSLPGGYYTTAHFMNLTNISEGGLPAIWNSISCLIGHLDGYECMGDAWNSSPEGGGFGAFNARYGWGNPSNPGYGLSEIQCRYFYDVMWNDDLYLLGVAHAMGDDEMSPPGNEYSDWCVKEYNLFGDPELPMWFIEATALDAAHDLSIGGASTVTVSVSAEGTPVEGARVCLQKGEWKNGDIYMVDNTDASGQCSFYVTPSSTGTISVVAWARDHVSYMGTIEVTGTGFVSEGEGVPTNRLGHAYPSPASVSAAIPFSLSGEGMVTLDVYDLSGRLVAVLVSGELPSGSHTALWDLTDSGARPVPAGIYRVRISAPGWTDRASLLVMR